jgi:hypothetical protein
MAAKRLLTPIPTGFHADHTGTHTDHTGVHAGHKRCLQAGERYASLAW